MAELQDTSVSGHAALSICESMLIAMCDLKVLSEADARGLLADAAAAHHEQSLSSPDSELHKKVADLIRKIMVGGNSLPRS